MITTDKKDVFIYKRTSKENTTFIRKISYIIKIETKTETESVTATDRKTSGYEVIVTSNVLLIKED